jgi:RNA polymerase sigma-70 factor (family 1)
MSALLPLTDVELLALLRAGDRNAFTAIYERYNGLLYTFAYKLTADREAAKDIVQELFISLWNKREETELTGALNSYLYSAVRYRFLKQVAHEKARTKYAEEFLLSMETATSQETVTEQELILKVEELLSHLPPKMARILAMNKLQHLSNKEIAEEMQLSEKTVKNLKTQAIRHLRLKLGILQVLVFLLAKH